MNALEPGDWLITALETGLNLQRMTLWQLKHRSGQNSGLDAVSQWQWGVIDI